MYRLVSGLPSLVRRSPILFFSLGFALLLVLLFYDPLLLSRTFVGRDLVQFFLPIEKAVHEAWREGRIPLWMPEASFGRPLAANPNTGAFYPIRIAMAVLPFPLSFKLFPILHLWLAGVGIFLLARSLGVSLWGSAFSAVVYALCGPAFSDLTYPNILPGLAGLPFVLWAAGRWARAPSAKAAALFGLVWGLDLLVGDVFTAGLAFLGAIFLAWQETSGGRYARTLGGLLLASLPGFLLAAIQIVPTLLFTPLTVRALGRFPLGETLRWSVSVWRMAEFFIPFPFGNAAADRVVWGDTLFSGNLAGFFSSFYAGVFAAGSFLFFRPQRRARIFFYGFAAVSLLLSVIGFYLPRSFWSRPSFLPFRYPEKLMVGVVLLCALSAGFLLDVLNQKGGRRVAVWPLGVSLLLTVAAFLSAAAPHVVESLANRYWTSVPRMASFASQRTPQILLEAAGRWALLAGVLLLWTKKRRMAMMVSAFVLVVWDLCSVGRSVVSTAPNELIFSVPPAAREVKTVNRGLYGFTPLQDYVLPERPADPLNQPYQPLSDKKRNALTGLVGASFGVFYSFNIDYDLSDFYRVHLARREFYRDNGDSPGVLSYLAAFSARSTILERGQLLLGFSRPVKFVGPNWVVVNPEALPTIRFAERVLEVRSFSEAYSQIHGRKVDLSRTTVVETGRQHLETLSGGRIVIKEMKADRIELRTQTPARARLLLVRAYSPFRQVSVDGLPQTAPPTNLCLTSIALPPGNHAVRITEKLPGGAAGPALTLCGALILTLMAIRPRPTTDAPMSRAGGSLNAQDL